MTSNACFGAMPTNICQGSCTLPCSSRGLPRPHSIGVPQSCQRLYVALGISSSLRCLHLVCFATLMPLLRAMRKNCTCCVLRPDLPKASPKVACLPRADSGAVGGREPVLPCPADAGREDEGPGTPMSLSSSMAAAPLGRGREGSEGPLGRMRAADAVVACADCNM